MNACFVLLQKLFARKLGFEDRLSAGNPDPRVIRSLAPCKKLSETITYQDSDKRIQRRIAAYFDASSRRLLTVGKPRQFALQTAEILVDVWRLGQQSKLAIRLGSLLEALDDEAAFEERLREFTVDYEVDASDVFPSRQDDFPSVKPSDEVSPDADTFDGVPYAETSDTVESDVESSDDMDAGHSPPANVGALGELGDNQPAPPITPRPVSPATTTGRVPGASSPGSSTGGSGTPDTGGQPGAFPTVPPRPRKANDWFRVKANTVQWKMGKMVLTSSGFGS